MIFPVPPDITALNSSICKGNCLFKDLMKCLNSENLPLMKSLNETYYSMASAGGIRNQSRQLIQKD